DAAGNVTSGACRFTVRSPYATRILSTAGLAAYWRLGEASGTIATDSAGTLTGTYEPAVALGAPGALSGDADTAAHFDGGRVALGERTDLPAATNALLAGAIGRQESSYAARADIDEVAIYRTALSADELAAHAALATPPPSAPGTPGASRSPNAGAFTVT